MKLPKFMTRLGDALKVSKISALSELPTQPPPKPPKPGGLAYPGFRKNTVASASAIPKPRFDVTNVDLTATHRNGATTADTVRSLTRVSPELSGAVSAALRVGIPEKYIAIARDPDGTFNLEATKLVLQLLRQMNTMPDYINGFSQVGSLRSVSEALGKEMLQTGAMAMELVLDKQRLPSQFMPVATSSIIFYEDGKGVKPVQKVGGDEIDLDIATFFWVALDPSLYDIYPQSPMESAIQPVLASTTFLSSMRKLCERHVFQRYDISIDEEKLRNRMPESVAADPDLMPDWLNSILAEVESAITELGVDEALIHFDFFEIKYIEGDNGETPNTFETVNSLYASKIATASKTPPSVLGLGSVTASVASTETLMFMMNANGAVRLKLQELYSKALTLAVRLFGLDVTVHFEFDEIELRAANELMSFKQMKYEYLTNLVSIGFMTDEEACLRLTGNLPQNGYTIKWDTNFKNPAPAEGDDGDAAANNGNPVSPTSTGKKPPKGPKGPAK
jgi:hypothetical protein